MTWVTRLLTIFLALFFINGASAADKMAVAPPLTGAAQSPDKIAPYAARFGRTRPVVAVVGENAGTVLPDYVIPYGILAQSGIAEVVSVATQPGLLKLPPLQIRPDSSVNEFDQRYPEGADYVFVPALDQRADPTPALSAWIASQVSKGATIVSICNGSLVLAKSGVLHGIRATGHFSTYQSRVKNFPDTTWLKNARYVVDGKIVSSSGVTAAIPTSLAVVEAIGGTERAAALAKQLGVDEWSTQHDSDAFQIKFNDYKTFAVNTAFHRNQDIGIPVAAGVDEMMLSLVAEAYSVTFRSKAYAVAASAEPIKTRNGLVLVPDRVAGEGKSLDWMMPAFDATPLGKAPDKIIGDIEARFGSPTARWVMLDFEYSRQGL